MHHAYWFLPLFLLANLSFCEALAQISSSTDQIQSRQLRKNISKARPLLKFNAIGCFHCQSLNGDNPGCDDPFNSTWAYEQGFYQEACMTGMKHRQGLYPSSACLKIKGYYKSNPSFTVTIRSCTVDAGSMTSDTELIRTGSKINSESCGQIALTNVTEDKVSDQETRDNPAQRLIACIDICTSSHGCNGTNKIQGSIPFWLLMIINAIFIQ